MGIWLEELSGKGKKNILPFLLTEEKRALRLFLISFAFLIRTATEKCGMGLIVFGKFLFRAAVPT